MTARSGVRVRFETRPRRDAEGSGLGRKPRWTFVVPRAARALPLAFACALALVLASRSEAGKPATPAAYRDGWTEKTLGEAIDACTDSLVEGAWQNTKREQGVDPAKKLTPEIRAQLAPQIAAFRRLCVCTIETTAKKYGRADHATRPAEMETYAVDLVKRGVCKSP